MKQIATFFAHACAMALVTLIGLWQYEQALERMDAPTEWVRQ